MRLKINRFNFHSLEKDYRLHVIDKLHANNTFCIPYFKKLVIFINLVNLANFNEIKLISSAFALFLITGRRPYITRFGLFQTYHQAFCDVMLSVEISCFDEMTRIFQFIGCYAFHSVSKNDLIINELKYQQDSVIFFYLTNLNFLRVVETHYIFFQWSEPVYFRLNTSFNSFKALDALWTFFKVFKFE